VSSNLAVFSLLIGVIKSPFKKSELKNIIKYINIYNKYKNIKSK
jgi:hypothetical protein